MATPGVTGSITQINDDNGFSQSVTIPSDTDLTLVFAVCYQYVDDVWSPSVATLGGDALTKEIGSNTSTDSGQQVTLFYLKNPSTGSQTLTFTYATTNEGAMLFVVNLKDVDTSGDPFTDADYTADGTDDPSVSVSSTVNDYVYLLGGVFDTTVDVAYGSGQTELKDGGTYNTVGGGVGEKAGASGTVSVQIESSESNYESVLAVSVKGVTGLAAVTPDHIASASTIYSPTVSDDSTPDIKVQSVSVTIGASVGSASIVGGGTDFDTVASLDNAFILMRQNRQGGTSTSTENSEIDDNSVNVYFTSTSAITVDRPGTPGIAVQVEFDIIEYIGGSGGANEFLVRDRVQFTAAAGASSSSRTISTTPTDIDKCIPFYSIQSTDTTDGANNATASLWCSGSNSLNYHRGGASGTTTIAVEVVEFTGSAWSVGHGVADSAADSGTITLNDDGDGTSGGTFDVSDWDTALICHSFRADANSDTNQSISDTSAVYTPTAASTTQVDFTHHSDHAVTSNRHFVHVLVHGDMVITRFSGNTSSTAGATTIDITSAGLTDLEAATIIGSSYSSGGGTAYARGFRNYSLNSLIQAEHYCGRSGNTMLHELQVIDLVGIVAATGVATVFPDSIASASTVHEPTVTVGAVAVTPDSINSASTVYEPTVNPQAVTIAPNSIGSASAVYEFVITVGAVEVSPDAVSGTSVVYEPTVSAGSVAISPDTIGSAVTVYTPTITPQAVTISPDIIGSTAAIHALVVTPGAATVMLDTVDGVSSVYEPIVSSGAAAVLPDSIASAVTVYAPTITLGAVTISFDSVGSDITIFEPTISTGAATITPDSIASASTVYEPTATPQPVTISLNTIDSTVVVHPQTIAPQPVTVIVNTIDSVSIVYSPFIFVGAVIITPDSIDSVSVVHEPTATPQAVVVSPDTIDSVSSVYPPTISTGASIVTPDSINSSAQVFEPTITAGSVTVSLNTISSELVVYEPVVTLGAVVIAPDSISSGIAIYEPTITTGTIAITPDSISSSGAVHEPVIATGAVVVAPDFIATETAVYEPVISVGSVTVAPDAVGSAIVIYAPVLAPGSVSATPDAIDSASLVYSPTVSNVLLQLILLDTVVSVSTVYGVGLHAIPTERIFNIEAEDRVYGIATESRTYDIAEEIRVYEIEEENRLYDVAEEIRSYDIIKEG